MLSISLSTLSKIIQNLVNDLNKDVLVRTWKTNPKHENRKKKQHEHKQKINNLKKQKRETH